MSRRRSAAVLPLAAHGGTPPGGEGSVIDFSASLNAYGAAPVVAAALRDAAASAEWQSYPDPASEAARAAAARRWNVSAGAVTVGAGAAELIYAVANAFVRRGDTVLVARHAFAEYARASRLAGGRMHHVGARDTSLGALGSGATVEEWLRAVRERRPALAFVCSPGNPAGRAWRREELHQLALACRRAGTLLVIDQAYDAFTQAPLDGPALPGQPGVLHLMSLTKAHAIAGVRAAVAVADEGLVAAVDAVRPPWPVSHFTQAAVVACFTNEAETHVRETTTRLRTAAAAITAALEPLGIRTAPSATHILLAHVRSAPALCEALLTRFGIRVRDCTSFGLPHHVRVAARTTDDNARLVDALVRLAESGVPLTPDPDDDVRRATH